MIPSLKWNTPKLTTYKIEDLIKITKANASPGMFDCHFVYGDGGDHGGGGSGIGGGEQYWDCMADGPLFGCRSDSNAYCRHIPVLSVEPEII